MKFKAPLTCPACAFERSQVTIGTRGTMTITCLADDCGAQTFVKSPAGVLKLYSRLGIAPPGWKATRT